MTGIVLVVGFALWVYIKNQRKSGQNVVRMAVPAVQYLSGRDTETVAMASNGKMSKAQRRRRQSHFSAYVGLNGASKTATMIWDTLPDLEAGLPILSTVALLAPEKAQTIEEADKAWGDLGINIRPVDLYALPHPLWVPFTSWKQLLEFKNGVVLLDEVQGVADGRDSSHLPTQVANHFAQFRRNGIVCRWSTLDYSTPDKRIRLATALVTYCKGYYPKYEDGKIWGTKQIFWLRSYKGDEFDDFTSARNRTSDKNRIKPVIRQWVRLHGALKPALTAYDTMAGVLTLGAHNDAGMCMSCGGRRTVPQCSCPDHVGRKRRGKTTEPPASVSEDGQGSSLTVSGTGTEQNSGRASDEAPYIPRRERRARRELSMS